MRNGGRGKVEFWAGMTRCGHQVSRIRQAAGVRGASSLQNTGSNPIGDRIATQDVFARNNGVNASE